jgi:hypothetical protein
MTRVLLHIRLTSRLLSGQFPEAETVAPAGMTFNKTAPEPAPSRARFSARGASAPPTNPPDPPASSALHPLAADGAGSGEVPRTGTGVVRQRHAVPGNWASLYRFRERLGRYWHHALTRRSQTGRLSAERVTRLLKRWLPRPRLVHPYPEVRFDARYPR